MLGTATDSTQFSSSTKATNLVLPSKHTNARANRGRPSNHKKESLNGFQRLQCQQEPVAAVQLRRSRFEKRWDAIRNSIDSLILNLHANSIRAIVDFVKYAYQARTVEAPEQITLPYREIPTALVFAGINIPDHDAMFSQMSLKLQEADHLVATLPSRDCPNLKSTAKSMIEQFIGMERGVVDEEQEEGAPLTFSSNEGRSARLPNYDMQILECWYRQIKLRPNLVVIVPDFESFIPNVLEDLIAICSEYQDRLPIVFLFGIATTIETLHQSLPRSVLSLLRTEKFKLQNSQECINAIVEEIFIKNAHGFKIGEHTYVHLIDSFQLHTLSIRSFVRGLQYAMMDHYYANSLSILTDCDECSYDEVIGLLNSTHALEMRMLRSFRSYIEANVESDPDGVRSLLLDDRSLFLAVPRFLKDLQVYHNAFQAGFECLLRVQTMVNAPSFKRPKRNLYTMALAESLGESDYVASLLQVSRKRKLVELLDCLTACHEVLKQMSDDNSEAFPETVELETLIADADRFGDLNEEVSSSDDEDYLLKYGRKRSAPSLNISAGRQTKVAKKLKPIEENLDQDSYQYFAKSVADFFARFFKRTLRCHTELPLHEVVYYNNAMRLKKAFNPQPRAAIQTALGNSQHYLSCTCCSGKQDAGDDNIQPTAQDAAIAYKLYLECGRMINLYDWFIAFGAIIEKEAAHVDRSVIQARFIQAVTELQFTGFIRPTSRKTDHVLRLTWGSV
ncbi:Origin recognition complex subunit 3 [Rhizophlyctis rosea]|nr:Origin recognition complex subunit 3 [Rhizophlyctis rosea]